MSKQQREYMRGQLAVRVARLEARVYVKSYVDGVEVIPPEVVNDRRDIATMRRKLCLYGT